MLNPLDYPILLLVFSLAVFWFSAWLSASFHKIQSELKESTRGDLTLVLGGTLTLLGLIIGFTFSMAVSRYDQRKNYEEEEANAIGTEYVRSDFLPASDADRVRALLKDYLNLRILHYNARFGEKLSKIDAQTARLQEEMWAAVAPPNWAQPTQVGTLVVSGMNDVLNSQGYAQAA